MVSLVSLVSSARIIARKVVTSLGSLRYQLTIKFETFAVNKKSDANEHALKADKNNKKIKEGIDFSSGDDVQENE